MKFSTVKDILKHSVLTGEDPRKAYLENAIEILNALQREHPEVPRRLIHELLLHFLSEINAELSAKTEATPSFNDLLAHAALGEIIG